MKRFFKKLFSLLVLICVVYLIYYFCHPWIERQVMKAKGMYYIHKGDQAYSQDNMAKTLEFYEKGLKLFPGHYEAWFNLGNIYAVYEDYFSAVNRHQKEPVNLIDKDIIPEKLILENPYEPIVFDRDKLLNSCPFIHK